MKIFLSWAGSRSLAAARAVRELITVTLQTVDVFTSDESLPRGIPWGARVLDELERTDLAILLVTRENVANPWLTFEAGAHWARRITVIPLLVDMSPVDLKGPLAFFQASTASREDMYRLLAHINELSERKIADASLKRVFHRIWPEVEHELSLASPIAATEGEQAPFWRAQRQVGEQELLKRLEEIQEELAKLTRKAGA